MVGGGLRPMIGIEVALCCGSIGVQGPLDKHSNIKINLQCRTGSFVTTVMKCDYERVII